MSIKDKYFQFKEENQSIIEEYEQLKDDLRSRMRKYNQYEYEKKTALKAKIEEMQKSMEEDLKNNYKDIVGNSWYNEVDYYQKNKEILQNREFSTYYNEMVRLEIRKIVEKHRPNITKEMLPYHYHTSKKITVETLQEENWDKEIIDLMQELIEFGKTENCYLKYMEIKYFDLSAAMNGAYQETVCNHWLTLGFYDLETNIHSFGSGYTRLL